MWSSLGTTNGLEGAIKKFDCVLSNTFLTKHVMYNKTCVHGCGFYIHIYIYAYTYIQSQTNMHACMRGAFLLFASFCL